MIRRSIAGLIAVAGLGAAGWALVQRRRSGRLGAQHAVQWPFAQDELRSLMARVIAGQRECISAIEDTAGRARAQSFLEYYERRRQVAAS